MAAKTYIQLVNAVLKRLRETPVGAVSTNILSSLVGEFVNEAKSQVEDSHDWKALEKTITLTTEADTKVYSLTGAGEDPKFLLAYNDTVNSTMTQRNYSQIQRMYLNSTDTTGPVYQFAAKGIDVNGDVELEVYPIPSSVESLVFRVVSTTVDLDLDTDTMLIKDRPVVQLALAMAIAERGEEGSISSTEQFQLADRFLSDAIAKDANSEQGTTDWSAQ